MNYFKSGLGLVVSCFMLLAHGATPAQGVANVRFASGLVTASVASQSPRALAKGDNIENGSRIETAANGRVQMRFTDGGLVSLMPNSTFSVEDYEHQEGVEDGALVFGLLRGGLRTMTGAIGKTRHEDYRLNTPVATLGIRGTQFTVVVEPSNTLRVHVGEGMVVITNSSGSLEVPAGKNAMVAPGSAPAFAERGPMYLATAPGDDRLVAAGEVRQDPLIGPPLTDLDILRRWDELVLARAEPPVVTPPVVPPPVVIPPVVIPPVVTPPPSSSTLPDGSGYAIAGVVDSSPTGPGPWQQGFSGGGLTGAFDSTTGGLLGLGDFPSLIVIQPGQFQTVNVETSGALSWGEFTDGTGALGGNPTTLGPEQYMPYVVGLNAINVPATGVLNYSLDGATAVRSAYGDPVAGSQLDQFDLGLSLGDSTYTLDMQLSTSAFGVYNASAGGGTWSGSPAGFRFDDSAVLNPDGCGYGCRLEVEGFLAGPNAEQAGVGYMLVDNDNAFIGAAGLKQ